jgi:hypothetical protein
MKKKITFVAVMLFVMLLLITEPTHAMGWETESQTSYSQGRCAYIVTTETFYFLGIAWSTRTSTEIVGCDPGNPSFYTPAPL